MIAELAYDRIKFTYEKILGKPFVLSDGAVYLSFCYLKDIDIYHAVAANPNTPLPLLNQLARHPDENIRCAVASNRSTPSDLLTELSNTDSFKVLSEIARNPNASYELLDRLFHDENSQIALWMGSEQNKCIEWY